MKELLGVIAIVLVFAVARFPVGEMFGFHSTLHAQETPKKERTKGGKKREDTAAKKAKKGAKKGAGGVSPDTPKKDGGK